MNEITKISIAVVGNKNVGKTSIILRYVDNYFYNDTRNIDFDTKNKIITIENKRVNLHIFDTFSRPRFNNSCNWAYDKSNGIMIVFDLTNIDSFFGAKILVEATKLYINKAKDMKIAILVGNKNDLVRKVSKKDAEKLAIDNDLHYFEVSALNNTSLDDIFDYISTQSFHYSVLNCTF